MNFTAETTSLINENAAVGFGLAGRCWVSVSDVSPSFIRRYVCQCLRLGPCMMVEYIGRLVVVCIIGSKCPQ